MILADTSVWIDHFRSHNTVMAGWLDRNEILIHPFVLGELLLGGLHRRHEAMRELRALPSAPSVETEEVAEFIEAESLDGRGIGYVDTVLLASARLRPGVLLWTLDRKLRAVASGMEIAAGP